MVSMEGMFKEAVEIVKMSSKFSESCRKMNQEGKCSGSCCGMIPFNRDFLMNNLKYQQRAFYDLKFLEGYEALPLTDDLKCIFLTPQNKCAIYENRPEVCRKYFCEGLISMVSKPKSKDYHKKHKCLDCSKLVTRAALRCTGCAIRPKRISKPKKEKHKLVDRDSKGRFINGFSPAQHGRKTYANGKEDPKFKERRFHQQGYVLVYCPNHPFRQKEGRLFEHRFVYEEWLKKFNPDSEYLIEINGTKYLNPKCIVHHKDGNKINNIIENLAVFYTRSEHGKLHGRKKRLILTKCSNCEKEIYKKPSRVKMYKRLFCSILCRNQFMKGKKLSEIRYRKYGIDSSMPCPHISEKGNIRSPAKARRAQRKINHDVDNKLNILGKKEAKIYANNKGQRNNK